MTVNEFVTSLSVFTEDTLIEVFDGTLNTYYISSGVNTSFYKGLVATSDEPSPLPTVSFVLNLLNFANPESILVIDCDDNLMGISSIDNSNGKCIIKADQWFVLRGSEKYLS